MEAKILKWQEPPPAKTVKPLDKPDAEVREGLCWSDQHGMCLCFTTHLLAILYMHTCRVLMCALVCCVLMVCASLLIRCAGLQAKKRRGGRRLRKMKERYGLTDVSDMFHQ